ncbi:MAG: hypothetical protein V4493_06655, partial [Pseudomonadota bacterium]
WIWKISKDESVVDMLCDSAAPEILFAEVDNSIDKYSATIYGKGLANLVNRLDIRNVRSVISKGWWCLEVEKKKGT